MLNSIVNTDAKQGEIIRFGRYPQGTDPEVKTDIEWTVLDRETGRILVTSRYLLDCGAYCRRFGYASWPSSLLRKWLNVNFLNSAFSPEELEMILPSKIKTDISTRSGHYTRRRTEDRIFVLDTSQVKRYFRTAESRKCLPTEYLVAKYAESWARVTYESPEKFEFIRNGMDWWLRGADISSHSMGYVSSIDHRTGAIDIDVVFNPDTGIRPAMWLKVK